MPRRRSKDGNGPQGGEVDGVALRGQGGIFEELAPATRSGPDDVAASAVVMTAKNEIEPRMMVSSARLAPLPRIGETMLERGLLSEADLEAALEVQQTTGNRLGDILLDMGAISPVDLTALLAERLGVDFVDLDDVELHVGAPQVPEEVARRYCALPIAKRGGRVIVAMARPDDVFALDDLRVMLDLPLQPVMAERAQLLQAIERVYGRSDILEHLDDATNDLGVKREEHDALVAEADSGPIVRLVNSLLNQAMAERASDIHIEPMVDTVRIRFRTDGVLHQASNAPASLLRALVSRIKVMGNMDITERRVPQDGRFSILMGDASLDVRVATIPTSFGEAVVMRLLDRVRGPLDLTTLGMAGEDRNRFEQAFRAPQGGIIVSGPTGSGKTSTVYATLLELNTLDRNIVSVEDPVEYQLPGVKQMQVHLRAGVTFASALRSLLRADPDVVVVGEIRDAETAKIAAEACITGHLVLSTLHTTRAAAVPTRLIDMGVEPYVVASALTCVVAQRLVRRLCVECAESYVPDPALLRRFGCPDTVDSTNLRRAVGCSRCQGTGYLGRTALYETMPLSAELSRRVLAGASSRELEQQAVDEGMHTLHAVALQQVLAGELTIDEMMRVIVS